MIYTAEICEARTLGHSLRLPESFLFLHTHTHVRSLFPSHRILLWQTVFLSSRLLLRCAQNIHAYTQRVSSVEYYPSRSLPCCLARLFSLFVPPSPLFLTFLSFYYCTHRPFERQRMTKLKPVTAETKLKPGTALTNLNADRWLKSSMS